MMRFEEEGELKIPKPKAEIQEEVMRELQEAKEEEAQEDQGRKTEVKMKILTYNMNTMRQDKEGSQGIGTTEAMMEILYHEGVHIAVIQETRINTRLVDCNHRYYFHQEEAKKGKGGILVAISRDLEIDEDGTNFKKQQITYLGGSEEHIILRVQTPSARFVLVGGHAPHSGHDRTTIEEWWKNLENELDRKAKGWDIVAALDTNARFGGVISEHVSSHQEEGESPSGEIVHQFLARTNQWLPATFKECQQGDGKTMMFPNGALARLDFVALPLSWKSYEVKNEIRNDLTNRDSLFDHRPVLLEVRGQMEIREEMRKRRKDTRIDLKNEDNRERFRHILKQGARSYPWDLDIHTHVTRLNTMLRDAAEEVKKKDDTSHKKKHYLESDTWREIQEKRVVRRKCFEGQAEEKRAILRKAFKGWCKREDEEAEEDEKERRFERAKNEKEFKERSKRVTNLVRRDDRAFYERLAKEMKEKEDTKESAGLWRCVRRHIPKWRERKRTRDPGKDERLDKQWEEHMSKIEAAIPRSTEEVYARCVARQNSNEQEERNLYMAPTLLEVERALRQSKPGKASGMDNIAPDWLHFGAKALSPMVGEVAFKGYHWMTEPIQHKGGKLVMIDKKKGSKDAANFRPIMLISSMGRRLHSLLRPQVMKEICKNKREGQIGGFRGQEAVFGSHFTRTMMRIGSSTSHSTAVICLDLQTAFHALIRQTTLGDEMNHTTQQEEKEAILKNLQGIGANKEGVKKRMEKEATTDRLGFDKGVARQLQEIAGENWSSLYGHEFQTLKGTRPGSPLADSVFHIAMSEVQGRLQEILDSQAHSKECWDSLKLRSCPITWADDVALILISKDPELLRRMIEDTTNEASQEFRGHGLTLNYSKAKSEVLVSMAGKKAGEARRKLLSAETEDHKVTQEDDREMMMKAVSTYKHLGTKHQAGGKMDEEVKFRCEQAWAAWRPLSKHIFLNRHLKVGTKIELLQSLIFTRLYYGAGAWPVLTKRQMKKLEVTMMKMIRGVMGCTYKGQKEHWSDKQVLIRAGLPGVRERLAKERLTYAKRFFQKAEAFIIEAVYVEEEKTQGSWLSGLREDLTWMHDVDGRWPSELEEIKEEWTRRGGWKAAVKKTILRHGQQERIAYDLRKKLKDEGWRGEEEEEEKQDERWVCECGSTHTTKTGLAVHKRHKHGKEGDEYKFGNSSRCQVCLREFWSAARLRQHLGYVSRKKKPNWCWKLYSGLGLRGEEEETRRRKDIPQQGINRRENITLHGPKLCGATRGDKAWAEAERDDKEEEMIGALGLHSMEEALAGYTPQKYDAWYEEGGLDSVLMNLEEGSKCSGTPTLYLALWGEKKKWKEAKEKEDWSETVRECEGGRLTKEWVRLQLLCTELNLAEEASHGKEAYRGRANEKEREADDKKIVRMLCQLDAQLTEGDFPAVRKIMCKALDRKTYMVALRGM